MQQAVLSCVRHQAPERLASEDDAIVALAGDRRFPPSKLAILVDELQAQGLDAEVALAGTGLTVETLRDPFTLTSCAQFMRACRQALKVYPGDDLGLRMGCRFRASSYGMYGYALLCSESVRKMWDRAMAYHPLSGGLLPLRWAQERDVAVWTFPDRGSFPWPDVDERLYRFIMDLQLAAHVTIGKDVMGPWFVPAAATLVGAAPAHLARIEAVLQCPVRVDESRNSLVFPADWLERAPQLANPFTASHVSLQCARLLDELRWNAPTTRKVYEEITRQPGCFPDVEDVAARLCMTSRTLRRHLDAEGVSYSDLLTTVRKRLAIDYLVGTQMRAEDIAEALDFADVAAFRHAFKRWTGLTPRAYREAQVC